MGTDTLVECNKSNKTNNNKLKNNNVSPCKMSLRKRKSKDRKSIIANIQKHKKIESSSNKQKTKQLTVTMNTKHLSTIIQFQFTVMMKTIKLSMRLQIKMTILRK